MAIQIALGIVLAVVILAMLPFLGLLAVLFGWAIIKAIPFILLAIAMVWVYQEGLGPHVAFLLLVAVIVAAFAWFRGKGNAERELLAKIKLRSKFGYDVSGLERELVELRERSVKPKSADISAIERRRALGYTDAEMDK